MPRITEEEAQLLRDLADALVREGEKVFGRDVLVLNGENVVDRLRDMTSVKHFTSSPGSIHEMPPLPTTEIRVIHANGHSAKFLVSSVGVTFVTEHQ